MSKKTRGFESLKGARVIKGLCYVVAFGFNAQLLFGLENYLIFEKLETSSVKPIPGSGFLCYFCGINSYSENHCFLVSCRFAERRFAERRFAETVYSICKHGDLPKQCFAESPVPQTVLG
jgi:hypothetical protein